MCKGGRGGGRSAGDRDRAIDVRGLQSTAAALVAVHTGEQPGGNKQGGVRTCHTTCNRPLGGISCVHITPLQALGTIPRSCGMGANGCMDAPKLEVKRLHNGGGMTSERLQVSSRHSHFFRLCSHVPPTGACASWCQVPAVAAGWRLMTIARYASCCCVLLLSLFRVDGCARGCCICQQFGTFSVVTLTCVNVALGGWLHVSMSAQGR